jgi:hypothetical protein
MKLLLILGSLFLLTVSADKCNSKETGKVYKGKLEIKAMCMNYTVRLVEGDMDTALIVKNWTDESSGKSYQNVFTPGNPCDLPASVKEGDEFYFTIDTAAAKECIVCMAYYPKPPKSILIKVVDK